MTCRRARALLSEYIDERLPLDVTREIRVHLDACPACRSEWQEWVVLKRVLASARAPHALPGFWDAMHQQIREQDAERRPGEANARTPWWQPWWQRAPALVGAAAALVAAILMPLTTSRAGWDTPALDTRAVLARHATYCSQLPLTDRRSMDYIAAEARSEEPD